MAHGLHAPVCAKFHGSGTQKSALMLGAGDEPNGAGPQQELAILKGRSRLGICGLRKRQAGPPEVRVAIKARGQARRVSNSNILVEVLDQRVRHQRPGGAGAPNNERWFPSRYPGIPVSEVIASHPFPRTRLLLAYPVSVSQTHLGNPSPGMPDHPARSTPLNLADTTKI